MVTTGCGSEDPPSGSTDTDDDAFARTVAHKYGETTLGAAPERLLTVGLSDHDFALALGIVPTAVTDWYGDYPYAVWPWAEGALGGGTPEVMPRNEDQLNFELIASLRPDLILGRYTGMTETDYRTLSDIAPTVAQSADFPDYGMPCEATMLAVGDARAAHPEFAGRTAVVAEKFDTYDVRGGTDPRTRFLTEVDFVLPPDLTELTEDTDAEPLSAEQIDLLERDLLVWNAGFTPELRAELEDNALYQQLAVVREGRTVIVDTEPLSGALTWSTVLSLPLALEELVPMLADALGG